MSRKSMYLSPLYFYMALFVSGHRLAKKMARGSMHVYSFSKYFDPYQNQARHMKTISGQVFYPVTRFARDTIKTAQAYKSKYDILRDTLTPLDGLYSVMRGAIILLTWPLTLLLVAAKLCRSILFPQQEQQQQRRRDRISPLKITAAYCKIALGYLVESLLSIAFGALRILMTAPVLLVKMPVRGLRTHCNGGFFCFAI